MTAERDTTRILRSWLGTDEHESADRVLRNVLSRLDTTPQRRSWSPAWRYTPMNRLTQAAIAAAAVLVVGILGYNLLPAGTVGQPVAPTAAAASASPAPSPTDPPLLPEGTLAAGTYVTRPFNAPNQELEITVTVPEGWQGYPAGAVAPAAGPSGPDGGAVAFQRVTQLYSDPCKKDSDTATISAGSTVDDLVDALGKMRAEYHVGTATDVTVGGYNGKRIDVIMPSDVDFATCEADGYWIWDAGPYAQGPGNRWHISILDVDGARVVVLAHDFATTPRVVRDEIQDVVASIRFEP